MGKILLGTSGWSYEEWVGPFYASKSEPKLQRYSSIFETVEIDSTFYSYPTEKTVLGMARAVPPGFVFAAKVPREITHRRALDIKYGAAEAMDRFVKLMKPMGDAGVLGCLLIQLPPSMRYNPERLESFLERIDREFSIAVEFRHPSWMNDEAFTLLRRLDVAYTIVDEPLLPSRVEATADFAYVRWHGRGKRPWYNYHYTEAELRGWVEKLKELQGRVKRVYGYFNNHFHGYAVHNCIQVLEMLGMADERHKAVKTRLENYYLMGGVGPEEAALTASPEEKTRLLSSLVDIPRFKRAREIPEDQLQLIISTENYVEAKVKSYTVVIDAEHKVIAHDCDDWKKEHGQKRLCKHVVRLFLTLPEETAIPMLRKLKEELQSWSFSTEI